MSSFGFSDNESSGFWVDYDVDTACRKNSTVSQDPLEEKPQPFTHSPVVANLPAPLITVNPTIPPPAKCEAPSTNVAC